tara:strand:+ start:62 stop:484 length:423 start_codon:yes stop_codon:yes gene_type:complete
MEYSDDQVSKILMDTKKIALIDASHNEKKPSNQVMKYLLENNYLVYPVNNREPDGKIHGINVFQSIDKIPTKIDMVNIFQKNDIAGQTMLTAINLNIKYIWTQLNIFNFEAASKAIKSGHVVIMNRCTKIEHLKLIKKIY